VPGAPTDAPRTPWPAPRDDATLYVCRVNLANTVRYVITAAVFVACVGLLVAGRAGPGWALIVVSVGWAAHFLGGSVAGGMPLASEHRQQQPSRSLASSASQNARANRKPHDADTVRTLVEERRRRSDPR
jgi:hypothetical protein